MALMKNQLMAQYLRDPQVSLFNKMIEEGTSTSPIQSPWQGVARLAQAGLGGYMSSKIRGDYDKKADDAVKERSNAMQLAMGRPAESTQYGDTTINWKEQKPSYMAAASALMSPDNEDLANKFLSGQITQDQTLASQQFQAQQQQQLFEQQRQLAEMQAQKQSALQDQMLRRQIELEKYKQSMDPINRILLGQGSPTLGQVGAAPMQTPAPAGVIPQAQQAAPVQQPQAQPAISQQDALFNAALAAKGLKAPKGYMFDRNMQLVQEPMSGGKLTDEQAKALGFVGRLQQSNQIIGRPEVTGAALDLGQITKSSVPFVGNALVSPEYQQYDQASRDFVNAVLRRESGAAISPSEFDNARKQYFPQYGDTETVLDQKSANRLKVMEAIMLSGGQRGQQMAKDMTTNTPKMVSWDDQLVSGETVQLPDGRIVQVP